MGVRDGKHLQGGNWNYISGQIRIAKEEEAELQKQAEVYASEGKTPLFFADPWNGGSCRCDEGGQPGSNRGA